MARRGIGDLEGPLDGIEVISTDVFDTLLLRNGRSERARIVAGERRFSALLARRGFDIPADRLVDLRLKAQRLAFRALNVGGTPGEIRLADLIARQHAILGLPEAFVAERLAIEIEVEKASLRPNRALASLFWRQKQAGRRIIAVSDTTLPTQELTALIHHLHGDGLIDRVYSSADLGATKRRGEIFAHVAEREGVAPAAMLHVGDDEAADVTAAIARGFHAIHLPREAFRSRLRQADGARAELGRRVRRFARGLRSPMPEGGDRQAFGRDVLGPIVAEFGLMIWLYASEASDARLMFCARGGVGIREAFERLLDRLALPLDVGRETLLVSRLIAARAAVLAKSTAALDELGREFAGDSFADVARALGGRAYDLGPAWQERFAAEGFFDLLFSAGGAEVLADIEAQNRLFARHLADCAGGAGRLILCDTGLYGSTQRLLAAGFPDLSIETIQFARANYKRHGEEHFPRVAGLVVEQNLYNPLKAETSVLRYWQLVESLFEPAVPSVKLFHETCEGGIASNSGDLSYGKVDAAAGNALLTGALAYIDGLGPGDGAKVLRDAEIAWRRLRQAITRPSAADLATLAVGERSVDFGRAGTVSVMAAGEKAGLAARLGGIKAQLWREGAIAREFPTFRPALLAMLESAHALRGLSARLTR
ncbi:MAG: HAD family hydrolase [Piscinibacter sp.]